MKSIIDFTLYASTIINFFTIVAAVVLVYVYITSSVSRKTHYRNLRATFFLLYKISWFKLAQNSSSFVLTRLNYIYGEVQTDSPLFSKGYFNRKSWIASFTIALIYIVIGVFLLPYLFSPSGYFTLNTYFEVFGLITITIVVYYIYKEKSITKHISCSNLSLYLTYFIIILLMILSSNIFLINLKKFFIIIFICIPLFSVWVNGMKGLVSYIINLFMIVLIFTFITDILFLIEENDSNIKINNIIDPKYQVFVMMVLMFLILTILNVCKKVFNVTYFKTVYYFIVIVLLTTVYLIYISTGKYTGFYIFLLSFIYLFYLIIFIFGLVFSNSIADLASSNVSRFLFKKIQKYQSWKQLLIASIVDLLIGSILIIVTSILLGLVFASIMLLLSSNSPINVVEYGNLMNELPGAVESPFNDRMIVDFTSKFDLGYIIDTFVNSLYLAPKKFHLDFRYEYTLVNTDYSFLLDTIGYGLWYLYISTLFPTILHFFMIIIFMLAKFLNLILNKPAYYLHRLLIEKASHDTFFGKIFDGENRSLILIGLFITIILFVIYIILK